MNQLRILNPFNNVVASGIANCDLNPLLGTTLECINLTLGGGSFTKAMITLIQLKANGKVIFETDGTKLDATLKRVERKGPTLGAKPPEVTTPISVLPSNSLAPSRTGILPEAEDANNHLIDALRYAYENDMEGFSPRSVVAFAG